MSRKVIIHRKTRLDPRFPLSGAELTDLCDVLLDALGLEGREFSLMLVDDREIAAINAEFLGCSGPTNVLSFPDGGEDPSLGELVLSVDTLVREADVYGQPPLEHVARLLAHGILHLAGYDHGEVMFDLTDRAVDRALLELGADGGEW